ncbi:MAG TPA: hypothetical protein VKR31_00750 [Rhizomicrobium sp.]|nr:hypothetical protein [Rhizomicrobium sp.]
MSTSRSRACGSGYDRRPELAAMALHILFLVKHPALLHIVFL